MENSNKIESNIKSLYHDLGSSRDHLIKIGSCIYYRHPKPVNRNGLDVQTNLKI